MEIVERKDVSGLDLGACFVNRSVHPLLAHERDWQPNKSYEQ